MDLEYFPNFFRATNPNIQSATNEQLKEVGEAFKGYLERKFINNPKKLFEIWDISPLTVIKGMKDPFILKGSSPVLVLHFTEFVKEMVENERTRNKS